MPLTAKQIVQAVQDLQAQEERTMGRESELLDDACLKGDVVVVVLRFETPCDGRIMLTTRACMKAPGCGMHSMIVDTAWK